MPRRKARAKAQCYGLDESRRTPIVPVGEEEMLRAHTDALDGPADIHEAKKYRIVQGERICGWSCDPSSPYYEEDKHLCPAQCRGPGAHNYQFCPGQKPFERLGDLCPTPPPPLPQPLAGARAATCADDAATLAAAGVWLLIGVQTGPFNKARRAGVRHSWKRWEAEQPGVLICFLLGRVGLRRRTLEALDAEDAAHRDILWLPNATDAGVPTIKGYHWWTAAHRLLPPPGAAAAGRGVQIAAKVDDDSFLHVANLARDLRQLHCVPHLHYGNLAYSGYDPSIWRKCGFSWTADGANYRRDGCARCGAYPPFPFMNGLLELLSAPLVRYVATAPEVRHFVERAQAGVAARLAAGWAVSSAALKQKGDPGPRVWNRQEDMVVGFWLARAERRGQFRVAWVRINDRSGNVGCLSTKGMYQRPRADVISVHNLKLRGGLDYLYGLLHDGVAHSGENCTRWVYYDNCRDLDGASRRVLDWCKQHCDGAPCPNTLDPSFVSKPVRAEDAAGRPQPERRRCPATS